MDLGLQGKTVWITGASGGIGRALAEAFAAEGCNLVLHGHRQSSALRSWVESRPWRDRCHDAQADLRDADALDSLVQQAARRFGRVDACIANAGARPREGAPLHRQDPARIAETIAVNLTGAAFTARAWLRGLSSSGPRGDGHGASLVLIGSTAASFGEADWADYAAAKAGLFGLMRSLKNEVVRIDPHARVNLVEPGWTRTHVPRPALDDSEKVERVMRTMPLRRIADADDIAQAALWLASPLAARHVTGQCVTAAGGMEGRVIW